MYIKYWTKQLRIQLESANRVWNEYEGRHWNESIVAIINIGVEKDSQRAEFIGHKLLGLMLIGGKGAEGTRLQAQIWKDNMTKFQTPKRGYEILLCVMCWCGQWERLLEGGGVVLPGVWLGGCDSVGFSLPDRQIWNCITQCISVWRMLQGSWITRSCTGDFRWTLCS